MINLSRALLEKVDHMQEQMGNESREIRMTQRKCWALENDFYDFMRKLNKAE